MSATKMMMVTMSAMMMMMATMSARMMMMMAMMLAMMKLEVGRFPLISQEGSPGQSGNQRALVTIAHSTLLYNVHV